MEQADAKQTLGGTAAPSASLEAQVSGLQAEKEKLIGDVTESMKTINRLTALTEEYKSKLEAVEADKVALKEELGQSQNRIMDVFKENEDLRIKVLDATTETEKIQKELKLLTIQNQATTREKEELEKKLSKASRPLFSFGRKGKDQDPAPRAGRMRRHSVEISSASQTAWQRRFCGLGEDEQS